MNFSEVKNSLLVHMLLYSTTPLCLSSCITQQSTGNVVYVCTGPKAYAFHKKSSCSFMINSCTGSIQEISLVKAKQMGRKPCNKCTK